MNAEKPVGLRIRFGAAEVMSSIRNVEIQEALFEDSKAKAEMTIDSFIEKAADFRAMSRVLDGDQALFLGWVGSVDVDDGVVRVSMRNGYQLEGRFQRFTATNGIAPTEMAWSIGRMAGFPEDNLHIQGFQRDFDRFHVAMPVMGVAFEEEARFGPVRLTGDIAKMRTALGFVTDSDWVDELVATGTWAIAEVEAGTLFEAEQQGVELITGTLDRLTVESQYSFALSPAGEGLSFRRENLFTDPQVVRVALVLAATRSGRAWVRTLDPLAEPTRLNTRRIDLVAPPMGVRLQFDEAIRAWRRALESKDRIAAATAISEAIEFYAAGAAPSLDFSADEMAALRRALLEATDGDGARLKLSSEQRERLGRMLGMLNEPSLKERLLAALADDGVPFSREEVHRVWRIRNARNAFVHGKGRDELDDDDLDLARAFVNRLIVWWGRSGRVGRGLS